LAPPVARRVFVGESFFRPLFLRLRTGLMQVQDLGPGAP